MKERYDTSKPVVEVGDVGEMKNKNESFVVWLEKYCLDHSIDVKMLNEFLSSDGDGEKIDKLEAEKKELEETVSRNKKEYCCTLSDMADQISSKDRELNKLKEEVSMLRGVVKSMNKKTIELNKKNRTRLLS